MAQPLTLTGQHPINTTTPIEQGETAISSPSSPPTSDNKNDKPESQPEPTTSLPIARLIRTTHTQDGTSIFSSDSPIPPISPFGPQGTSFTVFDTRASLPADNIPLLPRRHPPGQAVPVHRTQTLDYCTVLSGQIDVGLDGGETKAVRVGDFIVQQGVNHEWVNRSGETCRILFVMLGADKIQLQDGKAIEQTVF
ncbi:Cupin-domain-containing oxidoreductase srdD [Cladobotryum mycophilum]|uniref:Cupin-domain-containing oxidoreductase srdD n=1 Tax=Cladobotryum mycophilum TaxID=491253 RepID=A0ABR0STJ7_9HYPO